MTYLAAHEPVYERGNEIWNMKMKKIMFQDFVGELLNLDTFCDWFSFESEVHSVRIVEETVIFPDFQFQSDEHLSNIYMDNVTHAQHMKRTPVLLHNVIQICVGFSFRFYFRYFNTIGKLIISEFNMIRYVYANY